MTAGLLRPSMLRRGSYLPGPQALQLRLRRGVERRRQRDDRAGVQVAVGPAVEPLADAGRERVVDGRVAERAGDADMGEHVARR